MVRTMTLAALAASAFITSPVFAEDPTAAYNTHCRMCHGKADDEKGALGPGLKGIMGQKSQIGGNFVWDEATMDQWIKDPNSVISGNGMSAAGYGGIADEEIRKAIIEKIKQSSEKKG